MALLESRMIELGTLAPAFELANANVRIGGATVSLSDYTKGSQAFVIMFICNHCPYVKVIEERLISLINSFKKEEVAFIGICSNDPVSHPSDSFDAMRSNAESKKFPFPYLQDLSQEVAKAYGAECTPDFFAFDQAQRLIYRGRLDDGNPSRGPVSFELHEALSRFLKNGELVESQNASIGCSIKWRNN